MKKTILLAFFVLTSLLTTAQKNKSCMDRAYDACEKDFWCSVVCLSNPITLAGCTIGWATTCLINPDINWEAEIRLIMEKDSVSMWMVEFPKELSSDQKLIITRDHKTDSYSFELRDYLPH